jgi:hypothetical protein
LWAIHYNGNPGSTRQLAKLKLKFMNPDRENNYDHVVFERKNVEGQEGFLVGISSPLWCCPYPTL